MSNRWFAESKGYTNTGLTIEDVRDNFVAILEREGAEPLLDPVESAKSLTFAFKPKPYQPE